jgi:hypothetical protein
MPVKQVQLLHKLPTMAQFLRPKMIVDKTGLAKVNKLFAIRERLLVIAEDEKKVGRY